MRLIDADELLRSIKRYLDRSFLGETTSQTDISIGGVASIVLDQPTLNEWIPVEQRLPKEFRVEFLTRHAKDYMKSDDVYVTYVLNNERYCSIDFTIDGEWVNNKNIIAWMPLPQPYKKGELE